MLEGHVLHRKNAVRLCAALTLSEVVCWLCADSAWPFRRARRAGLFHVLAPITDPLQLTRYLCLYLYRLKLSDEHNGSFSIFLEACNRCIPCQLSVEIVPRELVTHAAS